MRKSKKLLVMLLIISMLASYFVILSTGITKAVQSNVGVEIRSDNDAQLKLDRDTLTYEWDNTNENKFTFHLMNGETPLEFSLQHEQVEGNTRDFYQVQNIDSNENLYIQFDNYDSSKIKLELNGNVVPVGNDGKTAMLTTISDANHYNFLVSAIYPAPTQTINFGTASWTIGETVVTASVANKVLTSGAVQIAEDEVITLANFSSETMQAKVQAEDGFNVVLNVNNNGTVTLADRDANTGFPSNQALTFIVEAKNSNQGNPQNPGDPNALYTVYFGDCSWTIGEGEGQQEVTATIAGVELSNGIAQINENQEIALTGFNPETMQVRVASEEGFSTILSVDENGKTKLANHDPQVNVPRDIAFNVEAKANNNDENPPVNNDKHTIDFGSATWTVKGQEVTATITGKDIANKGPILIDDNEKIVLTGFDPQKMEVVVEDKTVENGMGVKLDVNDNNGVYETRLANIRGNMVLPPSDVALTFMVQQRTSDGPDTNRPEGNTTASVTISSTDAHRGSYVDAMISINEYPVEFPIEDNLPASVSVENVKYLYNGETDNNQVTFGFAAIFLNKYVGTITINNVAYTVADYIDYNDRNSWLDHYSGQTIGFNIEVPKADNYNVVVDLEEMEGYNIYIGNFLWTSDESQKDTDEYIGHSELEVVRVEYELEDKETGEWVKTVVEGEDLFNHKYIEYDPWGRGETPTASLVVPEGSKCTMRISPEYGYQVTAFGINGQDIITGDAISEFTFPIHKGNFHIGAKVTPVDDVVNAKSDKVKTGEIEIGKDEIASGTVVLSVGDVKLNEDKTKAFEEAAGDYTISDYLDIDLDQVIYKGTADDVWSNRVHELKNEATITLQLEEEIDGNNIIVVHNVNDGEEYEIIEIESYDPATNTITFKTKSFSSFAIAVKGTEEEKTEQEKYTIETEDFILVFSDDKGHTFKAEIQELWNLTADELKGIDLSEEEYANAKKDISDKVKEYGVVLNLYGITIADGDFEHTGEVTIKIKMTDEMKKYNKFTLVCIDNEKLGEKDVVELKAEGEYLVGNLYHLSNYALVADKVEEKPDNPGTGDNIMLINAIFGLSAMGFIMLRKMNTRKSKH